MAACVRIALLVVLVAAFPLFAADGPPGDSAPGADRPPAAAKDDPRPEPNACGCQGMAPGCCSASAAANAPAEPPAKAAGCGCGMKRSASEK
jgi:hypothetical protein